MSQPPAQTKIEFCPTGNQVYLVKDPQKPADSQKVQGGAMYGENLRRKWQILPGRNKYYCDGRIIMARQTSVFYVNLALIVGTMGLFFGFDAPYLWNELNPVMPLIAAALTLLSVSSLVRCAFSDPGILPRATPAEAEEIERQIAAEAQNSPTAGQGNAPHPRLRTVIINGQPVNMKYCMTCKVFRPPRASHCGICDNCIDRFDHHCPWVGNCVGKRNYRYFYFFLVSLSFLCVYVFACSAVHLILMVVALVCFFAVWSVLGLAGFHTYLITANQTTNEDIKGTFSNRRHSAPVINPFSDGSYFGNCYVTLCGSDPPSLIDRRGFVPNDYETRPRSPASYGTVPQVVQNNAPGLSPLPNAPSN